MQSFVLPLYAGTINVWSLMIGREPIHRYQHNQKLQALALGLEGAAIASASGFQVKVESSDDRGYWQTTAEFEIQKLVSPQMASFVPRDLSFLIILDNGQEISYKDLTEMLHKFANNNNNS